MSDSGGPQRISPPRWSVLIFIALVLGVFFASISWIANTQAESAMQGLFLAALARIEFLLTLPLRLVAILFARDDKLYGAYGIVAGLAFVMPLFWLMGGWGVRESLRRRFHRKPDDDRVDASRRAFLRRAAAGGAGAGAALVTVDASLLAPQRLQLREYTVPIADLPSSMEGLRIAHVSDTHRGPYITHAMIEHAIRQANALEPDLALLTGDFVYHHRSYIEDGVGLLSMLKPRIGSLAVLGNHDHWQGTSQCREAFAKYGIPLLDNARVFLDERGFSNRPRRGTPICIAGLGDLWADRCDFGAALGEIPEHIPRIVLSHNPDIAAEAPRDTRIDLMLSGHTHGGQVRFPGLGSPFAPSKYGERFIGGMCEGSHFPVVVSRGVGLAGIPVRFRVPPEIGVITLTRAG